jgi:hypothetical protein
MSNFVAWLICVCFAVAHFIVYFILEADANLSSGNSFVAASFVILALKNNRQ